MNENEHIIWEGQKKDFETAIITARSVSPGLSISDMAIGLSSILCDAELDMAIRELERVKTYRIVEKIKQARNKDYVKA